MKNLAHVFLAILPVIMLATTGCKSKTHKITAVTSDTVRFYPVNEYITGQINRADSVAGLIYKISIKNGVKDSSVLSKQQFNQLARAFLEYNISDKSVHNYYKESTFMDDATHSYTINYTAADSSLPLQNLDILLDVESAQVKRVFLSKFKSTGAATIAEKDGWKNNESFFINRVTENNGSTTTEQNIIVWQNVP